MIELLRGGFGVLVGIISRGFISFFSRVINLVGGDFIVVGGYFVFYERVWRVK